MLQQKYLQPKKHNQKYDGQQVFNTIKFESFKHPVYHNGLGEDLSVHLEFNAPENVVKCTGNTTATDKILGYTLEYDVNFDVHYATMVNNCTPEQLYHIPR